MNFRSASFLRKPDPNKERELKEHVRNEINEKKWNCKHCKATKRANVYGPSDEEMIKNVVGSLLIVIKCRACGHEEGRYYSP